MKKYLFIILLLFSFYVNAQTFDKTILKKIGDIYTELFTIKLDGKQIQGIYIENSKVGLYNIAYVSGVYVSLPLERTMSIINEHMVSDSLIEYYGEWLIADSHIANVYNISYMEMIIFIDNEGIYFHTYYKK
jgi:hypothetical protein